MVDARVLVLGLAFKENCPDLRNTRVIDAIDALADYGLKVDVHDPWVDGAEARHEYGLDLIDTPAPGLYDAVVLAVPARMAATLLRAIAAPASAVLSTSLTSTTSTDLT